MPKEISGDYQVGDHRFAIVVTRFNDFVTAKLLTGALDTLHRHGAADENITLVRVPGAFEIPLTAAKLAQTGNYDAIICLGCIIRGETPHFDYICAEVAKGVAQAGLHSGIPATFGVITADTLEQAVQRAGSKAGNKGADAAMAAIEMVNVLEKIEAV